MQKNTRDSIPHAKILSEKALKLLESWSIPASPVHYAVAYEIARGTHTELIQKYQSLIADRQTPDQYCLEQWQLDFLMAAQPEQEKLIRDLGLITAKLSQDIKGNEHTLVDYIEQLNVGLQSLQNAQETFSLNNVVDQLVDASQTACDEQNSLLKKLHHSEAQVDELRAQLNAVKHKAYTDYLTGLLNRRGLEAYIDSLNSEQKLILLVLDIDHFKKINDAFGHPIGDQVLIKISQQLETLIPNDAKTIRYGGEEFIVLFNGYQVKKVEEFAQLIKQKIAKLKFVIGKSQKRLPTITVSLGLACQQNHEPFESLLQRADKALYQAKQNGRNQLCCANT